MGARDRFEKERGESFTRLMSQGNIMRSKEDMKRILDSQMPLSKLEEAIYRADMTLTARVLEKHGEADLAKQVRNRLKEHITRTDSGERR